MKITASNIVGAETRPDALKVFFADRVMHLNDDRELKHCKAVVLADDQVKVCNKASQILAFPDDTQVLVPWPGQWSTNFVLTTVGDIRNEYEAFRR